MKAIVVDDEKISLEILTDILKGSGHFEEIRSFAEPLQALSWCAEHRIGAAFLDINMPGINGLDLASVIQKMQPEVYIVFVTASEKYALDAIRLHAFDYLMKPVKPDDIDQIVKHMQAAAGSEELPDPETKETFAKEKPRAEFSCRCFGNFDAFFHDEPIRFSHSGTKELLAYLVLRRGSTCSVRELGDILYPEIDNPEHQQSRLRTLVADLTNTLKRLGCAEILYKTRGYLAILPKKIDCDYYRYLEHELDIRPIYSGEFMAQYEWAEYVNAYIAQTMNGK